MITNLNEDEIDCDEIFTLCGVFADVQHVKMSYHSLNGIQLYGKMIHVNLSRMTRVKLPKDSPNTAMMFRDAKFLTKDKDYTNCKKHRYNKKDASGTKYSALSIDQPSHILHVANLTNNLKQKIYKNFYVVMVFKNENKLSRFGGNNSNEIQSIELIDVNNKLGSCQAFAKCHSVDIACQILLDFHGREFLGREIKISFTTRSHMPSDINKTHNETSTETGASEVGGVYTWMI